MDGPSQKRKQSSDDDQLNSKKQRLPFHATQGTSEAASSRDIDLHATADFASYCDTNILLQDMLDDSDSNKPTHILEPAQSSLPSTATGKTTPKQAFESGKDLSVSSLPPPTKNVTASSTLDFATRMHDAIMAQLANWGNTTATSILSKGEPEASASAPASASANVMPKPEAPQHQSCDPSDANSMQEPIVQYPRTPETVKTGEHEDAQLVDDSPREMEERSPMVMEEDSRSCGTKKGDRPSSTPNVESPPIEPLPSGRPELATTDSQQHTQSLRNLDKLQPWTEALEIHLNRLKLRTTPSPLSRNTIINKRKNTSAAIMTSGNKTLQLWWYDAYQVYNTGSILLFGKVLEHETNTYASCCVLVQNIKRTLYVLPRRYRYNEDENLQTEKVTMDDVKDEITQLFDRHHIKDWDCKIEKRRYAFELDDVPAESDYLEIQYSFKDPELPADVNGATYSHVFGTNNSPMELLLIKRGIKGPQWLEIKDIQFSAFGTRTTWCKYEFSVSDPNQINVSQHGLSPPLSVMSLHLYTIANTKFQANEIIAASVYMCPKVGLDQIDDMECIENSRFVVVRPWGIGDTAWPADLDEAVRQEKNNGLTIQVEDSEYSLLNYLCGKIHLLDPDVIVGHSFSRFTLDVLLHRVMTCNIPFWHKLGRIRWKRKPQLQFGPGGTGVSTAKEKALLAGRLVCDTMVICRTLIQAKSFHLSSLAETQLGIKRADDNTIIAGTVSSGDKSETTIRLAKHCWMDSYMAMALLFKFQVLPLTKKLTNIAGNLWSRTMEGSRMNRNEYLLLHEFHQMKYIYPDKPRSEFQGIELDGLVETLNDNELMESSPSKKEKNKESSYGGGLVLDPKTGLHENFVVLLDFNSLYPSIIQEFNICFTTVDKTKTGDDDLLPNIPTPDIPLGVLPRLMKRIVDERKIIKKEMKKCHTDESKLAQYDIEQNALKLTANSLYGSLGSGFSRFKARHLAAMVTSQGRTILRETVDAVEQHLDMDVVYGDTDSIMVATTECTMEKAQAVAKQVRTLINGKYNLLELGIDGYFRRLLILGKKNYASLTLARKANGQNGWEELIIPKGSNIVRKDVCEISLYATTRVLKTILLNESNKMASIHQLLRKINQTVRSGNVPLAKYALHKQLTKDLDKYASAKGQPHVQVALKLRKLGRILKAGDTVVYVVCLTDDENNATMADKATPIDEAENKNCRIDYDWYLRHEILPSVTRLCEKVMDTSGFASCLEVEMEKKWSDYLREQQQQRLHQTKQRIQQDQHQFTPFKVLNRVTGIRPFKLHCQYCGDQVEIKGYARYKKGEGWISGTRCPKCRGMMTTASISMQLILAIRYYIKLYYQGWLCCQELDCEYRTQDCIIHCMNPSGCDGVLVREYTEDMLYSQLLYFDGLFDIKKDNPLNGDMEDQGTPKRVIVDQYGQAFDVLQKTVRKYLDRCGYRYVDISDYV